MTPILIFFVNHGMPGHAAVHTNRVDFAINVIETGAVECTAESTAQSLRANVGKALVKIQAASNSRNKLKRDGVCNLNVFSCISVANNINLPDVSVVSPIRVDKLALQLCNHPDRNKVQYILNGFHYGFWLGFNPDAVALKSAKVNCPSAFEHPLIVDNYLAKEVSLGRVSGPLKATALDGLQISHFGVIPKKEGGWHLILDLSFPVGHSVNDGINKEEFTVTYSSV